MIVLMNLNATVQRWVAQLKCDVASQLLAVQKLKGFQPHYPLHPPATFGVQPSEAQNLLCK